MSQRTNHYNLRVHHVCDMVRDFGQELTLDTHPYGHSYSEIFHRIFTKDSQIRFIIENDDVCQNCCKLIKNQCIDSIHHRKDFFSKQEFNNYLDQRIIDILEIDIMKEYSIQEFIPYLETYCENINTIYHGNEEENTKKRLQNVLRGINRIKTLFLQP